MTKLKEIRMKCKRKEKHIENETYYLKVYLQNQNNREQNNSDTRNERSSALYSFRINLQNWVGMIERW